MNMTNFMIGFIGAMLETVLLVVILAPSTTCVGDIEYLKFSSGSVIKYTDAGKVATCQEKKT